MNRSSFLLSLSSLVFLAWASLGAGEMDAQQKQRSFHKNVKVSVTATHLLVESDGIPDHETGEFPNRTNPNRIQKQNYRFSIPLAPKFADAPSRLPMGPIGVALNGVPFYNPYTLEGNDAVQGPFAEVFDSCCGHPDQLGRYHYHKYPTCLKSPFQEEPGKHSPILGYAFDGFAIYGPQGDDGNAPQDLDECNGHTDADRGYHYHVTKKFPYILGAYKGVVDRENFDRRGRFVGAPEDGNARRGPPDRPPGFPPPPPPHPLLMALDANQDGELSAAEIDNAAESLKRLDRNGDGKLSRRELRP